MKPGDVPFSVSLKWGQWLAISYYAETHAEECIPGVPDPAALSAIKCIDDACDEFERNLFVSGGHALPAHLAKLDKGG